jgi:hypothetical protein
MISFYYMTDIEDIEQKDLWCYLQNTFQLKDFHDLQTLCKTRSKVIPVNEWNDYQYDDQYALFQLYPIIYVEDEDQIRYCLTEPTKNFLTGKSISSKRIRFQ